MDADEEQPSLGTPDPQERPEVEPPGLAYLAFQVGADRFAVPMRSVHALVRPCPVTPVPFVAPAVLGVFAVRGQVVPLLDLGVALGREPFEVEPASGRFLILEEAGRLRALRVASTQELLRVEARHRVAAPPRSRGLEQACLRGLLRISGELYSVVDPAGLAGVWEAREESSAG